MKKILLPVMLLLAGFHVVSAQVSDERDGYTATAAQLAAHTFTYTHVDPIGKISSTHVFSVVMGTVPSTETITITPCMGLPTDAVPVCGTATTSTTAATQQILRTSMVFDYYLVQVTWTGSPPIAYVNITGTHAVALGTKTGSGSYLASASSVPADGCATFSGGNVGSTGAACGGSGSSVATGTTGKYVYYTGTSAAGPDPCLSTDGTTLTSACNVSVTGNLTTTSYVSADANRFLANAGMIYTQNGIQQYGNVANGSLFFSQTDGYNVLASNVADSKTAVTSKNTNASSTGHIHDFEDNTGVVAYVSRGGGFTATSLTGPIGSTPNFGNFSLWGALGDTGGTPSDVVFVTSTNAATTPVPTGHPALSTIGISAGYACLVVRKFVSGANYVGTAYCTDGSGNIQFEGSMAHPSNSESWSGSLLQAGAFSSTGTVSASKMVTNSNCSSAASPAVCGSAAAGSVVVAAAATTVVVNDTAVTANSQIMLTFDASLGTKLGVTCNTTPAVLSVSARVPGTSFTVTSAAPTTNPDCLSFTITN